MSLGFVGDVALYSDSLPVFMADLLDELVEARGRCETSTVYANVYDTLTFLV
jgi:hypothetical protein